MSNNNKKKIKGNLPKFNFYWVYGIVAVILILINVLNPGNTSGEKTSYSEFKSFVDNKQVKEIVVINKKEARVYIFPDQLDQPPHKDKNFPKNGVFGPNNGPHYNFNIPNYNFCNWLKINFTHYFLCNLYVSFFIPMKVINKK